MKYERTKFFIFTNYYNHIVIFVKSPGNRENQGIEKIHIATSPLSPPALPPLKKGEDWEEFGKGGDKIIAFGH